MKSKSVLRGIAACLALVVFIPVTGAQNTEEKPNQVLEWNQIFIDTLIVTNTANSSSQRLGAIVQPGIACIHCAMLRHRKGVQNGDFEARRRFAH